ncbi:hypothetical protein HaLaN_19616 [Haematococcus lacustris]|uniref:Uncharacterized protein n=1 Tax=Haematococcus lacustris TaxID=44745 RepID=A0A699ZIR6_HAELA|nr:hypothetical protein HaLaN_19616 [Haematococcus lacustris]
MAEAVATTSGLQQNAHVHWPFAGIATGAPAQPAGTAAGITAGAAAGVATSSPRSSWIRAQWRTVAEGRGICLHQRAFNNYLLKCHEKPRKPL